MATATMTKPKAAPSPDDILQAVLQSEDYKHEAADEILFRWADGEERTAADWRLLQSVFGDRAEVDRELRRVQRVLQRQQQAGTESERLDLQNKIEAAEKRLEEDGPTLRSSIQKLTEDLQRLETAAEAPRRKLESMELAHAELRRLVPQHVKDSHNFRVQSIRAEFADVPQMEGRLATIDEVLRLSPDAPQLSEQFRRCVLHLESALPKSHPAYPRASERNGNYKIIDRAGWAQYLDELRSERAELLPRLEQRRGEMQAELAAADELLDCYT